MKYKYLLVILFSMFLMVVDVSAMNLKPSCPDFVYKGEDFVVNITLTRSNEEAIVSAVDGTFKYDSTKVELKSQSAFSSKWYVFSEVANNKKFALGNMAYDALIEETTKHVVTLNFMANVLGSVTMNITGPNATDSDGKLISISGGSCNVEVREPLSNINTLSDIKINGTSVANFNSNTSTYSKNVGDVSSVNIEVTQTDLKSTVTGHIGTQSLNYGLNVFKITVTSESGLHKVYTLNITREDQRSNVNTLKKLEVSDGTLNFNPNTTTYNVNVGYSVTSLIVTSALTDSKSSYVEGFGDREVELNEGNNVILIKVKSERGEIRVYTINVTRSGKSTINTLKTLTLSAGAISFNPTTTTYNITVAYDVSSITINSTLTDSKSSYVVGFGNRKVELNEGKNEVLIRVQAENGSIRTYTLNITRKSNKSEINTLKTLKVTDATFNFKPTTVTYNITVEKTVDKVKITSSLTDAKSSYVNGFGDREVALKEGKNVVYIKVKAESGDVRTYTLNITRKGDKSMINTLKSLTIDKVKFNFDANTLNYDLMVDETVTKVKISSELTDKKSSYVEGFGNRYVELKEGKNEILIKVKSEFGEVNTYTLNITRGSKTLTNTNITKLSIENYDINFSNNKISYNLPIGNENMLGIEVVLENEKATYEIIDNENLKNGSVVIIRVTAEDKVTVKDYKLNIIKNEVIQEVNKDETKEEDEGTNILAWIVCGGFFIGCLGILIKAISSRNKGF